VHRRRQGTSLTGLKIIFYAHFCTEIGRYKVNESVGRMEADFVFNINMKISDVNQKTQFRLPGPSYANNQSLI